MHKPTSFIALMLLLSLVACSPENKATNEKETALSKAFEQWQAQAITSYQIEVEDGGLWHIQINQVTVHDGQVTGSSARCTTIAPLDFEAQEKGECYVEPFEAEEYTVEALFERTRSEFERGAQFVQMALDPEHHFPVFVSFDDPDIYDEETAWKVVSFEVLSTP